MSALTLLHLWYRTYQLAFGLGARLLPWRRPEAVTGAGSFRRLPDLLQKYGARRPLVVASRRQWQSSRRVLTSRRRCMFLVKMGALPRPLWVPCPRQRAALVSRVVLYGREDCPL